MAGASYHWNLDQVEFATDVVFARQADRQGIYDRLTRADKLNKISQPVEENDRHDRGFNFFDPEDEELFRSLASGEFNISGFQNKDLRRRLKLDSSGRISRTLKRLRVHGLIKRVGRTYKYYLTAFGK